MAVTSMRFINEYVGHPASKSRTSFAYLLPDQFILSAISSPFQGPSACLNGAKARNRCAIARCAGSPTASAVPEQDRQNTKSLRASSFVEAVRLVCEHDGRG